MLGDYTQWDNFPEASADIIATLGHFSEYQGIQDMAIPLTVYEKNYRQCR